MLFDNRSLNVQRNNLWQQRLATNEDFEVLGKDLRLQAGGDLELTPNADLDLSGGVRNVVDSLFRRLSTPVDGYARLFRSSDGLKQTGAEIANPAINLLSGANTLALAEEVRNFLSQAAAVDGRLRIIEVELVGRFANQIAFNIYYQLNSSDQISQLEYTL